MRNRCGNPPNSSFIFARWQHRICNCMHWLGVRPPISPSLWSQGPPSDTLELLMCTCQMACKSVERFKHAGCTNVTDDRQTDHAVEKCVGIGGIACAARSDYASERSAAVDNQWLAYIGLVQRKRFTGTGWARLSSLSAGQTTSAPSAACTWLLRLNAAVLSTPFCPLFDADQCWRIRIRTHPSP